MESPVTGFGDVFIDKSRAGEKQYNYEQAESDSS